MIVALTPHVSEAANPLPEAVAEYLDLVRGLRIPRRELRAESRSAQVVFIRGFVDELARAIARQNNFAFNDTLFALGAHYLANPDDRAAIGFLVASVADETRQEITNERVRPWGVQWIGGAVTYGLWALLTLRWGTVAKCQSRLRDYNDLGLFDDRPARHFAWALGAGAVAATAQEGYLRWGGAKFDARSFMTGLRIRLACRLHSEVERALKNESNFRSSAALSKVKEWQNQVIHLREAEPALDNLETATVPLDQRVAAHPRWRKLVRELQECPQVSLDFLSHQLLRLESLAQGS